MLDYNDEIHDLRELEADEEDPGESLTIDEIDVNTGEVKQKVPIVPEIEHPVEEPVEEIEDEDDFETDLDEEMPSDDEIMAMEQGFEGGEE